MKRIFVLFLSLFFVSLLVGQAGRVKQLREVIELDSIESLLSASFHEGTKISSFGLDGKGIAFYVVQNTAPYAHDSIGVIQLQNGKYAVLNTGAATLTSNFGPSNFEKALAHAKYFDNELIIDGQVDIYSNLSIDTLTVRVKRKGFFNLGGNQLVFGSDNFNKGSFEAGNYKIFSDTVGVTFRTGMAVKANIMWWGAKPTITGISGPIDVGYGNNDYSGQLDNSPYFRAAANAFYESNHGKGYIYIPSGPKNTAYRIASPIYLGADSLFFGTINIGGDKDMAGFSARSKIIADFQNGPAIGVEGQRGTIVENLSILGMNGAHIVSQVVVGEDSLGAYWGDYGYAAIADDSIYSAIGIDAISASARKTSDVVIRDCNIMGFNVGVMVSQAGDLQGDLVTIIDNYFYANTIGIGIGDDQSRSVESYANAFTRGHTAFSNQVLGSQGEAGVAVTGGWVISHYQIASMTTNTCGIINFTNLYGEANGRIGSFTGSNAVPCSPITFQNCAMRTFYSSNEGYQNSIPYSIMDQNGMPVALIDCTIGVDDDGPPYILFHNYNSTDLVLERSVFEQNSNKTSTFNANQLIFSTPSRVKINDWIRLSYNGLANKQLIRGTETYLSDASTFYVYPYSSPEFYKLNSNATTLSGEDRKVTFDRINLGRKALNDQSVVWSSDTLTLTIADNNFELGELYVGDIIWATYTDLAGQGDVPALRVFEADRVNHIYKMKKLNSSVSSSVTFNNFSFVPNTFAKIGMSVSTGNFTSGSVYISNVTNINNWEVGDWIFSDEGDYSETTDPIRNGVTRVDSIFNDTILMTASAKISATGRLIHKHIRIKQSDKEFQQLPGNVLHTVGDIEIGGNYYGVVNRIGGTNTIQASLDSLSLTYSLFPAIPYTPTDSIPIDTTLNSFPITTRLDGDTLRQITYSVTKAPTIDLDLQVLIWDGSSYTTAFTGTIPAGQRSVTVSGAVAVATDERIFPEILTDSGASGLDLEFKFQKP